MQRRDEIEKLREGGRERDRERCREREREREREIKREKERGQVVSESDPDRHSIGQTFEPETLRRLALKKLLLHFNHEELKVGFYFC